MSLAYWINESIVCFSGMGKEVENLISENTELLATKYVFVILTWRTGHFDFKVFASFHYIK